MLQVVLLITPPCYLPLSSPLANFHIPDKEASDWDEVIFAEIYGHGADKIVRQYYDDAMGVTPQYQPSKRPRYSDNYGGGGGGRYPPQPPRPHGGGGGFGGSGYSHRYVQAGVRVGRRDFF